MLESYKSSPSLGTRHHHRAKLEKCRATCGTTKGIALFSKAEVVPNRTDFTMGYRIMNELGSQGGQRSCDET